jgi:glutathionyl-hydroquinone reductase
MVFLFFVEVYFVGTNCNYSQIITLTHLYLLIIDFYVSAIVQTTTNVSIFNLTLLMIDE